MGKTSTSSAFDDFFQVMTSSVEFKAVMGENFKNIGETIKDTEESLKQLSNNKKNKASNIFNNLSGQFSTIEAKELGNNTTKKTSSTSIKKLEKKEENSSINIKYFENIDSPTFGFKGVAGMDDLKEELINSFINPLKFRFFIKKLQNSEPSERGSEKEKVLKDLYKIYDKFKVGIPTGMLFYGPPGTGKTFITKKLAQELGAGFIKKSVGEFGSSYIHATSKNIKQFFDEAKKASEKGSIILFLDEIDSLISKRGNNVDSNKAEEVSQFLQEFNELEEAENLIVIAATNRPDHLDSAILRSGRFDKKIYIGQPDFKARKELFEIYIEKKSRPHTKLDYKKLAELTDGYVAADIETICDEVSRDASKGILDLAQSLQDKNGIIDIESIKDQAGKYVITQSLLEKAIGETISSLKMVDMSIFEKWEEKIGK